MSHTGDSRAPIGPGILPLQDHSFRRRSLDLDERSCLVAYRITGRLDGQGQHGQWQYDGDTAGDLVGAAVWYPNGRASGGRPVPAWSWCMPVVVMTEEGLSGAQAGAPAVVEVGDQSPKPAGGGADGSKEPGSTQSKADGTARGTVRQGVYRIFDANGKLVRQVELGGHVLLGMQGAGGGGVGIFGGFGLNVQPFGVLGLKQGNGLFGIGVDPWNMLSGFTDPMLVVWDVNALKALAKARAEVVKGKEGSNKAQKDAVAQFGGDDAKGNPAAGVGLKEEDVQLAMLPVSGDWTGDGRFAEKEPTKPLGWPEFPGGYYGLSVPATDEFRQVDQYHPTDPRLVAPHIFGPFSCGSVVADMHPSGSLDLARHAPLHTLFRVIRQPGGDELLLATNKKRGDKARNWLARSIGPSGQWDVCGGLVVDVPTGYGTMSRGGRILAHESICYGGPLDVGVYGDKHEIGRDGDGNPIHSLHISTDALYRRRGSMLEDGPLFFEAYYPEPGEHPYPVAVHLAFDHAGAVWKWWTTSYWRPNGTPRDRQPPTETPPSDPPTTPDGGDTGTPGERIRPGSSAEQRPRGGFLTSLEVAVPSLVGKATLMRTGFPDLRHEHYPNYDVADEWAERAPETFRLEAFGAQGGTAGGPHLGEAGEWTYTQRPGHGRALGGTAAGGFVVMPPEVSLEDVDEDLAPDGLTRSTVFGIMASGSRWGAGIPELSTGGLRDGYSWGTEAATGDLVFWRHDGAGTANEAFRFRADGGRELNDHANLFTLDGSVPATGGPIPATYVGAPVFASTGPVRNMTYPAGNQTIQVDRAGTYNIEVSVTFESVSPLPATYGFHAAVNGVAVPAGGHENVLGPAEVRCVAGSCSVTCAALDLISLVVNCVPPGGAVNVIDASLKAVRIE